MDSQTLQPTEVERNEDYTGSVCLLHRLTKKYPAYEEILIDAEDFPRLSQDAWRLTRVGRNRSKRAVRVDDAYLAIIIMEPPKGMVVDHRSGMPLDNRRNNLRVCTVAQNNANTKRRSNGTSRYRGVYLSKGKKWHVLAGRRSEKVFLGSFADEVEAARAYNEYAKAVYGQFARLNPV